jgi:hypothetical protein
MSDDVSEQEATLAVCCWMSGLLRAVTPLHSFSL